MSYYQEQMKKDKEKKRKAREHQRRSVIKKKGNFSLQKAWEYLLNNDAPTATESNVFEATRNAIEHATEKIG